MKADVIITFLFIVFINVGVFAKRRTRKWTEDFESYAIGSQWKGALDNKTLTKITDQGSKKITNKVLQVKFVKGLFGKESRVRYKVELVRADAYVAEYDVMFKKGFDFRKGGKLPGLCGGTCTTGCKKIDPKGWSARFMWKQKGKLILYLYDQDRNQGGDPNERYCGTGHDLNYIAKTDEWIRLRQEIRVNIPGVDNGSIKIFVNGIEKFNRNNLRLRGNTSKGRINRFYFTTFYGGSKRDWAPHRDTFAYFDNFNVFQN